MISVIFHFCLLTLGIKVPGGVLDSEVHSHCHVDCVPTVYSQALRKLGLVFYITYNFSSSYSLAPSYNYLSKSKLE
jgi:hypothetical protein